ncbi:serine hydrolase [Streptomyces sp. NPDC048279]|uniref:serine hydrolase n=1 Tax=Streptomyces sp. NPDC048279 TaxID=3154714 RepID=UPI003412CF99
MFQPGEKFSCSGSTSSLRRARAAGVMTSAMDDLGTWARAVATGTFPDGTDMAGPAVQKQRLTTRPSGIAGAGYGLGIFDVRGLIGHNGSLPGHESLAACLPSARTTAVVLLNAGVSYRGAVEPSTLSGRAITRIISPGHAFDLPARPPPPADGTDRTDPQLASCARHFRQLTQKRRLVEQIRSDVAIHRAGPVDDGVYCAASATREGPGLPVPTAALPPWKPIP